MMEKDGVRYMGFGLTTGKDYFKYVNGERVFSASHVKKVKCRVVE
jgi:hypothetical protein